MKTGRREDDDEDENTYAPQSDLSLSHEHTSLTKWESRNYKKKHSRVNRNKSATQTNKAVFNIKIILVGFYMIGKTDMCSTLYGIKHL